MIKRRIIMMILGMMSLIVFSACSASNNKGDLDFGVSTEVNKTEYQSITTTEDTTENKGQQVMGTNQKLVRTVELTIETKEFDQILTTINDQMKEYNAYIEYSEMDGRGYDLNAGRDISITVRIPKESLDAFIGGVEGCGTVLRRSETAKDVTLDYVDTKSRMKALELQKEKLFELLSQTHDLESIITLQDRISEVTYQLESYSSKLRTMDNQVDYSTLRMTITEVSRETKITTSRFSKMTHGFMTSLLNIRDGILDFCVGFVIVLPYLLVIGVITVICIIIIHKGKKHKKIKDDAKEEK